MPDPDIHKVGEVVPRDSHQEISFTLIDDKDEESHFTARDLAPDPEQPDALVGSGRVLDVESGFEHEVPIRIRRSLIRETGHFIVEHRKPITEAIVVAGTVALGSLHVRHKRHQ